jgi:general secretion pathway protein N
VATLLLLVVLLVLLLPARWMMPLLQQRLLGVALDGVHGLVWNGAADELRGADGRRLGRLQWRLSRRALWGQFDLQLDFQGTGMVASGHLQRDAQGRPVWNKVMLRADLATSAPYLRSPLGTPQGSLTVTLARAVLQADWPVELQGQAHWRDAAMQAREGRIALGNLAMEVDGANGVLHGQLHDEDNGPLQVEGQWQASPLGWRLDLHLKPRVADPVLRRWLARVGRAQADGSVRLQRRGGLAAATPEAAP